jgi:beta-glucosidase
MIRRPAIEAIRYRDPALPFGERADDLLGRLTAEEKIAMLHQRSPAVPRLGLAEFCTGMEGVHGASWRDHAGTGKVLTATVFPQPVGLAAAWDPDLAFAVGRATGRENRALHDARPQIGLNVWAPVVNLLRDPRWGRNEEGYSEDPLLSAVLGTAFSAGLSGLDCPEGARPGFVAGGDPGYLLTAPTLKHFLAYNNEDFRDLTSSGLRPRVLHEYDLVPFRAAIEAGTATGVMPSYNLVNGRPAHVSPELRMIREWTSQELLTCSDAWAPSNLVRTEHYFASHADAHAAALRAGLDSFTDQDAKGEFTVEHVTEAVKRGLVGMADVDRAVRRKLLIRLRLGEFDPDGGPFATAGAMEVAGHRELALTAARRCAVLLRNDGGLLPLPRAARLRVAVVGPLAATLYEDWYSPALPYAVTIADGLREAAESVAVHEAAQRVRTDLGEFDVFDWGGGIVTLRSAESGKYLTVTDGGALAVTADKPDGWNVRETFRLTPVPGGAAFLQATANQVTFRVRWEPLTDGVAEAAAAARAADVAVVVIGNDPVIGGREAHDRATLELPPGMARLVREVTAANPRTVLVIMSSYPYVTPDAPAVVWTSHAGQETGRAIAALLTGEHAFEGRLPQAWPASDADLPEALDYDIIKAGWTYQYATARPRFPFGHGLTYTTFGYRPLAVALSGDSVTATLEVTNLGGRAGSEVVQLYAAYPAADQPRRRLVGFTRVTLEAGETATATIVVPVSRLELWDVAAGRMALPGPVEILAGASSEDIRQTAPLALPAGFCAQRPARVAAADFDDYAGITLTDTSRYEGTSVTPADPARVAWVRYDGLHSSRLAAPRFEVACASPAGGRIEVWLTPPAASGLADGGPLDSVPVPCTGDRYSFTRVAGSVPVPAPAESVWLALHGPARLDWFQL